MKKIELKIRHEYKGKELEPEKDCYWIFIQKDSEVHPIKIPRALSNELPAWSVFEFIDPNLKEDKFPEPKEAQE